MKKYIFTIAVVAVIAFAAIFMVGNIVGELFNDLAKPFGSFKGTVSAIANKEKIMEEGKNDALTDIGNTETDSIVAQETIDISSMGKLRVMEVDMYVDNLSSVGEDETKQAGYFCQPVKVWYTVNLDMAEINETKDGYDVVIPKPKREETIGEVVYERVIEDESKLSDEEQIKAAGTALKAIDEQIDSVINENNIDKEAVEAGLEQTQKVLESFSDKKIKVRYAE